MASKHCANDSNISFNETMARNMNNILRSTNSEEKIKANRIPVVKLEYHFEGNTSREKLSNTRKANRKDNYSYATIEIHNKLKDKEDDVWRVNETSTSPKPKNRNIRITVKKVYETCKNVNLKTDKPILVQKNTTKSRQQNKLHAATHKKVKSNW